MAAVTRSDTGSADRTDTPIDSRVLANAMRALAMDAVENAKSGHPGMPMGMADVATVLFTRFMKFDVEAPEWPDRDRFVLSAGHGSMLLYALAHLLGYVAMPMAEIEAFRKLGSRTPGHPEIDPAIGVETTTGPLGQGLAMAVGMALAERLLQARFGSELVDHRTFVIAGDGDLMEGVSHEAGALAGHLRLAKLIVLYDDNGISIDGPTSLAMSDDHLARFHAYGWHAAAVDGHDHEAVAAAIVAAEASGQPSLIACRTTIGLGAPTKAGTAAAHGSPLGATEIARARAALAWPHAPFTVPAAVLAPWREAGQRGGPARAAWAARHRAAPQRLAFDQALAGTLPADLAGRFDALKRAALAKPAQIATRQASQNVLEAIVPAVPELIGGSADLTGSNNTLVKGMGVVAPGEFAGRYIHYGVREFAMAAAMNGLALHGGLIPYGGSFLVFTDYCRPAIRLSALMGRRVIYVMTHDSIGLGEDGPTHQPVEHLASLRAMPGLNVLRPCDPVETAECWQIALESHDRPTVLALTRQALPLARTTHSAENLSAKGAYVISPTVGPPQAVLIATGSEVEIALAAQKTLAGVGVPTSVVSMPCQGLFDAQAPGYRHAVLPPGVLKVAIEAASAYGWDRYVGPDGIIVAMPSFGASAPHTDLYKHFHITPEAVTAAVRQRLGA